LHDHHIMYSAATIASSSMSANHSPSWPHSSLRRGFMAMILGLCLTGPLSSSMAGDAEDAEKAVIKLAEKQEADGFDFRADIWARDLKPDVGKAVRVQFFKGNEYRVCVAVPPRSGVTLVAHVLDADGKPIETNIEPADGGWGTTLSVKPKRTGVYAVVMRQAEGAKKEIPCAMITGYK